MHSRGVTGVYMFNIHQDRPLVNPFSYTPGILQALETALSAERLTAYLRVTGGDRERALRLYLWNTEISAAFYGPLQGLEVTLRNALHRELARVFGTSWYDAPAMPLASRAQDLIREAKAAIAHSRKPVIPPRVVAVLSFGFWVSLLGPGPSGLYEMRLWRPILHHAFPHAKLPRKDVHHPLDKLTPCGRTLFLRHVSDTPPSSHLSSCQCKLNHGRVSLPTRSRAWGEPAAWTIPPAFDGLQLVIDHAITRVPHLPEDHVPSTTHTAQRITPRTGEDTLTVGLPRRDTIRPFDQPPERYHQPCEHLLHLLGLTRGMEPVIANAVKPFRQNMLDHPTDEGQRRDLFFLPLLGLGIVLPIAHPLPIIAQDAAEGDRGTHHIFRQVIR